MADAGGDLDAVVAETQQYLAVRPHGDGWVGETPPWFGPALFGGFVVGQAITAVTRTAPDGWRVHSLHAYFLRSGSRRGRRCTTGSRHCATVVPSRPASSKRRRTTRRCSR